MYLPRNYLPPSLAGLSPPTAEPHTPKKKITSSNCAVRINRVLLSIRWKEPEAGMHGERSFVWQALVVGFRLKQGSRNCYVMWVWRDCFTVSPEGRKFPSTPAGGSLILRPGLASVSGNYQSPLWLGQGWVRNKEESSPGNLCHSHPSMYHAV